MSQSPFGWIAENADGLAMSVTSAFGFSVITALLRRVSVRQILLGIISSNMLTAIAVPLMSIYWGLHWSWWAVAGGIIGLTSIPIMWTLMKVADRIESRSDTIADRALDRVLPTDNKGGTT
jgi:hypothetical protein